MNMKVQHYSELSCTDSEYAYVVRSSEHAFALATASPCLKENRAGPERGAIFFAEDTQNLAHMNAMGHVGAGDTLVRPYSTPYIFRRICYRSLPYRRSVTQWRSSWSS